MAQYMKSMGVPRTLGGCLSKMKENFPVECRSCSFYGSKPLQKDLYITGQVFSGGLVAWVVTHLRRVFLHSYWIARCQEREFEAVSLYVIARTMPRIDY